MNNVQELWTVIQPALRTILPSTVAISFTGLSLRKNTNELRKIQANKMGEIADQMLERGEISHKEYIHFRNIKQIAIKADEIYKKKKPLAESKKDTELKKVFDVDWFLRFYEDASNISNEDMQQIWAGILAGEVSKPGSFSKRTLDVLRNMSPYDAEMFQNISKYILLTTDSAILYANKSIHQKYQILVKQILYLEECGLLSSQVIDLNTTVLPEQPSGMFFVNNIICLASSNDANGRRVRYQVYKFNAAATQLFPIIKLPTDKQFVTDVIGNLSLKLSDIQFSLHRMNDTNYDAEPLNIDELHSDDWI